MNSATTLKLAALLAALTAIGVEDIEEIKTAGTLGPDIVANIQNLQASAQTMDASTINTLNQARVEAGLPPIA